MPDEKREGPSTEFGCALGVAIFLVGIIIGAWWTGRGAGDRFESIERSQERVRGRLYKIEKKFEETVDE
ncbi:hypothetical protein LCGC14_2409630 [marine sediment metagenome]|uniref:Uncharacterized protein n=1 Tax=marine sediment metagenome TaxID=412755 RepID=A0A0F9E520_9ZZZZ